MLGLVLFWLIMAVVVARVADSKGYKWPVWFFYGLLIWPIALVHILTIPADPRIADDAKLQSGAMKKCRFCGELVRAEAIKCRFCGEAI